MTLWLQIVTAANNTGLTYSVIGEMPTWTHRHTHVHTGYVFTWSSLLIESIFVNLPACKNLFVIPQIHTQGTLVSFTDRHRAVENWVARRALSQLRSKWLSSFLSQLSYYKQCPFHGLYHAMLFTFLCCLLVISLVQMVSKCLKCSWAQKAMMCLMEKTCVRWASFRRDLQCCWPWVQC